MLSFQRLYDCTDSGRFDTDYHLFLNNIFCCVSVLAYNVSASDVILNREMNTNCQYKTNWALGRHFFAIQFDSVECVCVLCMVGKLSLQMDTR